MIYILIGVILLAIGLWRIYTAIRFLVDNKYATEAIKAKPRPIHRLLGKKLNKKKTIMVSRIVGFVPSLIIGGLLIFIGIMAIIA
jgi:hypothetical protein